MPDRSCLTCKHFEASPVSGQGWCRNPAIYSPQHSPLVDQYSLACARHYGNFWEPAFDSVDPIERRSEPISTRARLRLFLPPPHLVPLAAGIGAGSASGSGAMSDGGPDYRDARGGRNTGGDGGSSPPGGSRATRTGMPQGQERTVSYQPEERYWTDYLRIALPVVGLLLMLGLFWYWASAVIGDDESSQPTPRPTNQVALVTEPVPTNTPQPQVDLTVQTTTPEPTIQPTIDPGATEGATTPPDEVSAPGKGFRQGDAVVVTSDVNLRADGSLEADVIELLSEGTELEVLNEAIESGGYFWIEVRVSDTDQEGFIADEFVEAAS